MEHLSGSNLDEAELCELLGELKFVHLLAGAILQPSVERFGILDFENYAQIAQAAYESAQPCIQAWKTTRLELA